MFIFVNFFQGFYVVEEILCDKIFQNMEEKDEIFCLFKLGEERVYFI